jgi:hypothetical protein
MRVGRTIFIAASHSIILTTTKNHLPKIANSSDMTWVRTPATHSLRDQSMDQLLKIQQQTREYKRTPQISPRQAGRVTIDEHGMINKMHNNGNKENNDNS